MKKAAEILGVDQNLVEERFAALRLTRLEEDAYIRDYIVKNCAMHGSFLAPLSRMMTPARMDSGTEGTEKVRRLAEDAA